MQSHLGEDAAAMARVGHGTFLETPHDDGTPLRDAQVGRACGAGILPAWSLGRAGRPRPRGDRR
ncbi:MAG: hypothetical protein K6T86_19905 [Pirellulales bacterium]|nr:hypothetical protein [Pirellulales bacterium]